MNDNVLGRLVYKITGDTASLESNVSKSNDKVKDLGKEIDRTGSKIKAFAKGAITATLVKSLIDASSRVEELESKFNTVFDDMSSAADKWAREYANSTSRGITATKEFLATQQDLRTGYGDTVEGAMEYSKAVVAITNDLASFSNIPIEQAMQSMQSGLNQQFEALRSLGVSLSVATLEQGEYARALGKTWEQMTALEKQEAILSGIVSQSKNALHQTITDWREYDYTLGDAARTSDSYANSAQGLKQNLEDLKAELGDALLPAATELSQLLTSLVKGFNNLPAPIQATTTAIGAFAASVALISGPIGITVGALSALVIATGQVESVQEKLDKSTRALKATTSEYNEITGKLSGNTDNLTESERRLLKIRQELQRHEAQKQVKDLARDYAKLSEAIDHQNEVVSASKARYDALDIVIHQGKDAAKQYFDDLENETSRYGKVLRDELAQYLTISDRNWEKQIEKLKKNLIAYNDAYKAEVAVQKEANADLLESVLSVAAAYSDGLLDIEFLKDSNSKLYNMILTVAEEFKVAEDNANALGETEKKVSFTSREWAMALLEQKTSMAESNKEIEKAYNLKKQIIAIEKEDAIRQLASNAGLIKSGEKLTDLDIDNLTKRIDSNDDARKELAALDEYYANEETKIAKEKSDAISKIEDEIAQKRKDNADNVSDLLKRQKIETMESAAAETEANDEYEKAYSIRKSIISDEREEAVRLMEEQVALGYATEGEISNTKAYYANKEIQLEEEKNKRIQDIKEENKKHALSMIKDQSDEEKRRQASELENIGSLGKATEIRIGILHDERDEALDAMQRKVDKGLATEEELNNIRQYYANEESRLLEEQTEKAKKTYTEKISYLLSFSQQFASSLGKIFSAQTNARIADIDRETQARLEALGLQKETEQEKLQREYDEAIKNGDMELAQEKERELERQRIEDESARKKAKLQREEAERQRKIAIFQATIDMLSAIIGFMADPGSYAGLALSAMAATTGAMQIAAIQAEPLPSYAVGAVDVSRDHIAEIHQGELIIPKTFADGIRDGDISIGGASSSVSVTIINNTGAEVSTERKDENENTELIVTIGKLVDSQISKGRFDKSLEGRYEIRRRNTRG